MLRTQVRSIHVDLACLENMDIELGLPLQDSLTRGPDTHCTLTHYSPETNNTKS